MVYITIKLSDQVDEGRGWAKMTYIHSIVHKTSLSLDSPDLLELKNDEERSMAKAQV